MTIHRLQSFNNASLVVRIIYLSCEERKECEKPKVYFFIARKSPFSRSSSVGKRLEQEAFDRNCLACCWIVFHISWYFLSSVEMDLPARMAAVGTVRVAPEEAVNTWKLRFLSENWNFYLQHRSRCWSILKCTGACDENYDNDTQNKDDKWWPRWWR